MKPGPRFLDTFQPRRRQASVVAGEPSERLSGVGTARPNTQRKAREQVQHFTYWNYVGIRPIAQMFAGTFPNAGTPVNSPPPGRSRLSASERKWVRQSYGPRWMQAHDSDITPLAESHPILELLHGVNAEDTWQEFAFETVVMLYLTGQFFWWLIPNAVGVPAELRLIPTQWITPHRTKRGWWTVRPQYATRQFDLPPEEILDGKFKSPLSKGSGWGPLDAGPLWVDNVEHIETSRWHAFRQGVNPDVLLQFEGEQYQDPRQGLLDRIEEKFLSRISGVRKTGKPMLIPPGVKAQKWSNTPKEMDYSKSGDQLRDNNLALIGTPKTVAGITSDVNRATVEGSLVAFCAFTMNPLFRLMAGVLTEKLAPRFDPRIRFWYPDCTPEDKAFDLARDESHFRMGALNPDEARRSAGREPRGTSLYDTGYLPAGLMPLDDGLQPADLPAEQPGPKP